MGFLAINKENLASLIQSEHKPILLDFWAPWCGPCQKLAPIAEQLARDREDFILGKVNIDEEMELAQQFRILSIPTLLVIKNGEISGRAVGFCAREEILKLLDLSSF